jgi:hypothetical protein
MSKITLVASDDGDWIGLYKDGVLEAEGHSLNERQVLEALGIPYEYRSINFERAALPSCPAAVEELP